MNTLSNCKHEEYRQSFRSIPLALVSFVFWCVFWGAGRETIEKYLVLLKKSADTRASIRWFFWFFPLHLAHLFLSQHQTPVCESIHWFCFDGESPQHMLCQSAPCKREGKNERKRHITTRVSHSTLSSFLYFSPISLSADISSRRYLSQPLVHLSLPAPTPSPSSHSLSSLSRRSYLISLRLFPSSSRVPLVMFHGLG